HPDDCDFFAGGCAALWRRRGDRVRFVSMTNGDAGHHTMARRALAERRRAEAARAAEVIGIEYVVLHHHDGELLPTLEIRSEVIRMVREFRPDLVLTHRPHDYHPDHRYTSTLVLDSAYLVTVPLLCPGVPHLETNPVYGYLWDRFERPVPFRPDVVVDIDPVMDLKWEMLHWHSSQFYEWLPYNLRQGEPPLEPSARRRWLAETWSDELGRVAESSRDALAKRYGRERAERVRFAEAFEIAEQGRQPSTDELRELFPLDVAM